MTRRFVVTAIEGHTNITALGDIGPTYAEVMVTAENMGGEKVRFRGLIGNRPAIGDVVEFDHIPEAAIDTFERDLG